MYFSSTQTQYIHSQYSTKISVSDPYHIDLDPDPDPDPDTDPDPDPDPR